MTLANDPVLTMIADVQRLRQSYTDDAGSDGSATASDAFKRLQDAERTLHETRPISADGLRAKLAYALSWVDYDCTQLATEEFTRPLLANLLPDTVIVPAGAGSRETSAPQKLHDTMETLDRIQHRLLLVHHALLGAATETDGSTKAAILAMSVDVYDAREDAEAVRQQVREVANG